MSNLKMHKAHFVIACLMPTAWWWVILLHALFSAHQIQKVSVQYIRQPDRFHTVTHIFKKNHDLSRNGTLLDFLFLIFGACSIMNPVCRSVNTSQVYIQTLISTLYAVLYCWRDGDMPNVNERRVGWTHDPVPLSLHILALCLNCIRGLCWPMSAVPGQN